MPPVHVILRELAKAELRILQLKQQLIARGYTGDKLLLGRSDGWSFRGSEQSPLKRGKTRLLSLSAPQGPQLAASKRAKALSTSAQSLTH
jgi:hypothetical protein